MIVGDKGTKSNPRYLSLFIGCECLRSTLIKYLTVQSTTRPTFSSYTGFLQPFNEQLIIKKNSLFSLLVVDFVSFGQTWKNELHELHGVQLLKIFSAKFVNFSDKFAYLNVQIRKNFKNIIFIVYK